MNYLFVRIMNQLSYLAIHTKSEKISHFQLRRNPVLITALTSLLFPAQLRLKPRHQGLIGQDLVINLVKPTHGTTMLFQMPPLKCEAMTHMEREVEIIWNPKFNLVSVKGLWWSRWIKKVSCFRIMTQDSVGLLDILGYTRMDPGCRNPRLVQFAWIFSHLCGRQSLTQLLDFQKTCAVRTFNSRVQKSPNAKSMLL